MMARHLFVSLMLCMCLAILVMFIPGSVLAQSKTGPITHSVPNAQAAQCLDTPEMITVPATGPEAPTSKTVLKAGQSYLLVMSGVFSYWDASGQTAE